MQTVQICRKCKNIKLAISVLPVKMSVCFIFYICIEEEKTYCYCQLQCFFFFFLQDCTNKVKCVAVEQIFE